MADDEILELSRARKYLEKILEENDRLFSENFSLCLQNQILRADLRETERKYARLVRIMVTRNVTQLVAEN